MAKGQRPLRVADRIQVELSDILRRRVKDPRQAMITVTAVEITPDLRSATVFVSTLESSRLDDAMAMLEHARGFLRSELGSRLGLRVVPELRFRRDRSLDRAQRVETLLREIAEEREDGGSEDPGS